MHALFSKRKRCLKEIKVKYFFSISKLIEQELEGNKTTANCAINYAFEMNEKSSTVFYDLNVSKVLKIN